MQIFAALVLTILPGSWILYGLRLSGIPPQARLAMAVALSPAIVGLQLAGLEAVGVPFATSAYALVFLNLPAAFLLVRQLRAEPVLGEGQFWLWSLPLIALLVAIPVLIWSLIPGSRTYTWSAMLHTDIIYTVARDGVAVEEASLAGVSLAYGWIGHSYWSVIGWLGDWAPTTLYPFTNLVWLLVTFVLSYHLGRSGLGLHRTTALLGVVLLFLGTNVVGIAWLVIRGYSPGWERYFGDIRYSPFLGKFYCFDTMIWGMALLVALALVYTLALRRRVYSLAALTFALLVSLALVYPVLFPAGLLLAGCFMLLTLARLPKAPKATPGEVVRLGLAILLGAIAAMLYLGLMTADRQATAFALSGRGEIRFKAVRYFGAMGPFMLPAALPFVGFLRRRQGSVLLLILSAATLSTVYVVVDLAKLEYKYVLAATICLAFLAAAAVDPLFRRHPHLGSWAATIVAVGLAGLNLLLVFQAGAHIPGNLAQGVPVDESSFRIALRPSEPDAFWTGAIREDTAESTVVIAQRPGVQLSPLVDRSMYVPSDLEGGFVPGYNLNQRFYLLEQRGYSAELYERRLEVEETLYTSNDEDKIVDALHELKALQRPVAIYFPNRDTYALQWLETQAIGRVLVSDDQSTVWLVDDPSQLP